MLARSITGQIIVFTLISAMAGCKFRGSELEGEKQGGKDGNNGDVVQCIEDAVKNNPQLKGKANWFLDHFETRFDPSTALTVKDLEPREIPKLYTEAYLNMAQALVNRIGNVDPYRVQLYSGFIKTFMAESFIAPDLNMPDVDRRGPSTVPIPKGCQVHTIVYQQTPQKLSDPSFYTETARRQIESRYIIEQTVWDVLDDLEKAVLIAHEVFFREARQYDYLSSKLVRIFAGFLLRNQFPQDTQRNSWAKVLLSDLRLPALWIHPVYGTGLATETLQFNAANKIVSARSRAIPDLNEMEISGEPKGYRWTSLRVAQRSYKFTEGTLLKFYDSGELSQIADTRTLIEYQKSMPASDALYGTDEAGGMTSEKGEYDMAGCTFEFWPNIYSGRITELNFLRSGALTNIVVEERKLPQISQCPNLKISWIKEGEAYRISVD